MRVLLFLVVLVGCAPSASDADAFVAAQDAAALDGGRDGGRDAGSDALALVDGGRDAGDDAGDDAFVAIDVGSDAFVAIDGGTDAALDAWDPCRDPDLDDDGHASIACGGDDCDDASSDVHPGAPELCDRLDDDCSSGGGVALAEDADGDMHAPIGASCVGGMPADDCRDTNADVHPGQTLYFTTPIPLTSSYDYDCDGADLHSDTHLGSCGPAPSCTVSPGWDALVPPCGNGVDYITHCVNYGGRCSSDPATAAIRYAACH